MHTEQFGVAACGPQEQYFSGLAEGRFQIQRCEACGDHQFYPRVLCVHCGGTALQWVEPAGRGSVYSFSVVRRKPEAGGDYNVALVDLEEGVRMMSRIDGIALEQLHIGLPVMARLVHTDGAPLLVFVPAEAA
ncbi:Zn-ribbon domain-containing OB-fold protein [Achromobacter pestifer]